MYELDEDCRLRDDGEDRYAGTITDRWSIGAVPNGGYVLALALRALERRLGRPDPIVASAYYLRPTEAGPVEVRVEAVKSGRRYATGEARLVQGGEERVRVIATFGELPDPGAGGAPDHQDGAPPPLPPRERCVAGRPAGATPLIAARFDMALDPATVGWIDGKPGGKGELRGFIRFADGRPHDLNGLAVVADGFPPPAFELVAPGWVPTLELGVHFRARPRGEWLACRFTTRFLFGGHLEEDGELWDETGRLVALSRQLAILPR